MAESNLKKRSVLVGGVRTSVSLENEFWESLREIAAMRGLSVSELATQIKTAAGAGNFTSAIRVYVLDTYRRSLRREP